MDKYEYKVRSEEISNLIDKEKYAEAVKIADTIDWRRVKSAGMLLKIAALYRINRRNEDSRDLLMLAYERYPTNRSVVYSLCELSIELDDVVAAIEYYKQFAKLAPKDNGVYTLRYRILEAQEASLEERIEILEELKKRDYQEEWAYELAYLYHRVGLSTKCVEECDDIILWFGDGSYVMKAMELKALHVPLTEVQQKKYENMLAFPESNYTQDTSQDETYQDEAYVTDYNNEQTGYAGQSYAEDAYGNESYGQTDYAGQPYGNESYEQPYTEEPYRDEQPYTEESYGNESYEQTGYTESGYGNESYEQSGYTESGYGNEPYDQNGYTENGYENESYEQTGYVDDGYGNLSYVNNSYQDNSYTGEFYVEQAYDENGNPIDFTNYETDTPQQEPYTDDRYAPDNYNSTDTYGNNGYSDVTVQQNNVQTSAGAGDMSQYNTINLQKVVAESMKELFPDGDDDVFAEDRGKYNSAEDLGSSMGDTRIFSNNNAVINNKPDSNGMAAKNVEAADAVSEQNLPVPVKTQGETGTGNPRNETKPERAALSGAGKKEVPASGALYAEPENTEDSESASLETAVSEPYTQTGKVAQMVTSVSEAAPEPHTGAIKKVLIPGEDARLIKAESDMDELRDITEKTVVDEHIRMEDNDENVYREQGIAEMEMTDGISPNQGTGSMNLDDVLVEWERMKQDNAKRHQEEIKQHILTQTGKIFANFDNSINSGILGELAREEAAAQKRNSSKFLEADDTGDIPQNQVRPAAEDEFETAYVTDNVQSGKTEKTEDAEPEKTETDAKEEYISELERVVAQELGGLTNEIPQTAISQAVNANPAADTMAEEDDSEQGTAEWDMSENNLADEAYYAEENAYINSGQTEPEDAPYYEDTTYMQEDNSEDLSYYEDTAYAQEDNPEDASYYEDAAYTQEDNPEDASYYEDTAYTQEDNPEDVPFEDSTSAQEDSSEDASYYEDTAYVQEDNSEDASYYEDTAYAQEENPAYYTQEIDTENIVYGQESDDMYHDDTAYMEDSERSEYQQDNAFAQSAQVHFPANDAELQDAADEDSRYDYKAEQNEADNLEYYTNDEHSGDVSETPDSAHDAQKHSYREYDERELDPEDAESIAEMAKEDALKTQEIKMNTADLSSLSEKIVATTKKEAKGAKREEVRDFTPEEQTLFENFAVTKKIKKQIVFALDNITLAAYTGNIIITGDAGLDTVRMAKNLVKEYQESDANFSGKLAKITGEKFNQRNVKDVFEKLNNGGIIIEKANGMSEEKLYEMALNLNQENLGIVVIMEDTRKEITKLLEKQAMIADYFNIRIDLMEMDNNALVAYAKNYALALEYSIDELGTLALYTRIANMQSGNHVVTKDEVRDIIDEAIWKSKKSKIKNFVDVLFARRYDNEDMIVLKERDFM